METMQCAMRAGRANFGAAAIRPAVLVAVGIALLALLGLAPGARAAQTFPQFSKFCGDGEAGGQCAWAAGLAASPANGHLFEVDSRNNRIQEFTPWGEFVKAFGWGVVASGPGNKPPRNEIQQLSVSATGGSFRLRYGDPAGSTAAETAPIAFQPGVKPTAAEVQAALVDAPHFIQYPDPFVPGDVNVSGPDGGPWSIEFVGQYADTDFGGGVRTLAVKQEDLTGVGAAASLTTIQDGGNYEICVPADGDVCRSGSPGNNPGQLAEALGIALDSSGDLYVVDRVNHRVEKYDPDGNFLLMFGGEVNETTGEDVCTAAQVSGGDVCGAGTFGNPGPGEGQFGSWQFKPNPNPNALPNQGDYIDVGPDDTIYVGDTDRIQRFGTDGSFKGQVEGAVAGELVQSLAVGGDGSLYVAFANTSSNTVTDSKPNVRRLDPSGSPIGQLAVPNPRGIALDSAGNVFAIDLESAFSSKVVSFTSTGSPVDLNPSGPGNGLGEGTFESAIALATTSPPTCGLASTNLAVGTSAPGGTTKNSINVFGGAPDPDVCPQPAVPPTIESQFASSVDTASAILKAGINPHFWPDTRYVVQFGTGKCTEGGCTMTQPASPGSLLTEDVLDREVLTRAVVLTGLQPGTTYHYRFVAESGGGGPVEGQERSFRTARAQTAEASCPNTAFRIGPSSTLPDCRAYELVSPLDKANGDVSGSRAYGLAQVDPTGQRMTFSSARAFGDAPGSFLVSQYLSTRQGNGWSTASISPPRSVPTLYPLGATTEGNYFKALTPDLCNGWVLQDTELLLTPKAPERAPNLYRRDNCGGSGYEAITSTPPPGFGPRPYDTFYYPTVQGFTADGSRTVFRANAALAVSSGGPRAPFVCYSDSQATLAYRWLRNGTAIGGATNPTYTPVSADLGKTLQCQLTATKAGRVSLATTETLQVMPAPATPAPYPGAKGDASPLPGAPALSGTPTVGSTMTCTPGTWQGNPTFAYQWLRDGTAIGGATASEYTLTGAEEGASLQCRLTGSNAGGGAVAFSSSVTVAANLPLASAGPQVSGSPEAGQTLTCTPGTWQGATSFAYQWLRNGSPIGVTTPEYTLSAADEGKAIQCRVAGANAEATVLATSPRVVVAPAPGTAPPARASAGAISGEAETGETLTCEKGSWSGSPTFDYQWLRDGAPIGGATSDEYTLTESDQSSAIQCQLSATNAGGTVVALDATSAGTLYAAPPAGPTPTVTAHGNNQLYISSGSTLRLVSVMPNGSVTNDNANAGTAWARSLGSNSREDAVHHAVSTDGSRVFWTANPFSGPTGNGTGPGNLYLRLNATEPQSAISGGKCTELAKGCTIPVSASNTARFVSANPEASKVIYMTGNANSSVGLQLFTGTVDGSGSEPTVNSQLIAAGVRGVMGVSEDASRIYFVSRQVLTSDPNSEGEAAVAGASNLYFYEDGSPIDFVATLSELDGARGEDEPEGVSPLSTPVASSPSFRSSRVSPDGLHLAFTATAPVTDYDNADAVSGAANAEVFLYDAVAAGGEGKLLCVSCSPSGGRPEGRLVNAGTAGTADDFWAAAVIPGWNSEHQPTRALVDNGRRVFFTAYDALVPADSNGRADVYQWEASGEGSCSEATSSFSEQNGGCVRLISSGRDGEDVEFMDATPDGSSVFFTTQANLVPDDYGHRDVYAARVNGGFAPRAVPPPGCEGEACQGPLTPPADVSPSSASFQGAGNLREAKPRACPKAKKKGKVKVKAKRKRAGKSGCVKAKKKSKGKKRAKSSAHKKKGGAR